MKIILPKSQQNCESLVDMLQIRAALQSNDIALRFIADKNKNPETMTYAILDKKAQAIASMLQKHKIKKGDRVLIVYPPGIELIAAYFGCLYAGAIVVLVYPPVNTALTVKLQAIIENSTPSLILSTNLFIQKFRQLKWLKFLSKIPIIKLLAYRYGRKYLELTHWDVEKFSYLSTDTIPESQSNTWHKPEITSADLAFLQYTSGSTGHPKGVMVTHGNLLHNLLLIRKGFNFNDEDSVVSWLPPYHDMGLIGGILQPLFSGVPCTLMSPMHFLHNPSEWLKAISDYKGTVSGAPNFAYNYCVEKIRTEQKKALDLSSWRLAFNGSEPIHPETLEKFYLAFKENHFAKDAFYPCYGLAEATLFVSGTHYLQGNEFKYVSMKGLKGHQIKLLNATNEQYLYENEVKMMINCGKLYQEVCIVHPKLLRPCNEGEIGEIWLHSESVAEGYWQNEVETEATFKAYLMDDKARQKHYLRTGDLGFMANGNLYVAGRLKDLIVIHGANYYPQDIELTVSYCHEGIRTGNCAAFAITHKDSEHLAIVCEVKDNIPEEAYTNIVAAIQKSVAKNHGLSPHAIALLPQKMLPKTTSGKIRRKACCAALLEENLPFLSVWKSNNLKDYSQAA